MARSIVVNVLGAAAILACASTQAVADSLWNHNGSVMRLQAFGETRYFLYEIPRNGMERAGVRSGMMLFDGYRYGDRYVGTARRFSADCRTPNEYRVEGRVIRETLIVLHGSYEVYADGCRPTGRYKNDELVFEYISTVEDEVQGD